jgi:hypothetical protein
MNRNPIPLAQNVGAGLRRFRLARGLRQEDVARVARDAGLAWTRAVVVSLEAGRRYLTIDEFARLTPMLQALGVHRGEGDEVHLFNRGASAGLVVRGLGIEREQVVETRSAARARRDHVGRMALARRVSPGPHGADAVPAATTAAGGELEQRVGRARRLDPFVVALVAIQTWTRSLTAERDRRVTERASSDAQPHILRALRGHVTRELVAELRPTLDAAGARLRETKRASKRGREGARRRVP